MKRLACCLLLCAFAARAAEPPPPLPEPEAVRPFRRTVRLHLFTDDPRVELRDDIGQTVCTAPCNVQVPVLDDGFRLDGPGLLSSDKFYFDANDTDVTLRVRTGQLGGRILGYTVAGAGTAAIVYSLFYMGLEAILVNGDGERKGVTSGPLIGLGVGAAVAMLGALFVLGARSTQFSREPSTGTP
jgi:hypothetical protein